MNSDKMDNKGYVMGGLAFLLIIPSIILLIVFVNMINLDDILKYHDDNRHCISYFRGC